MNEDHLYSSLTLEDGGFQGPVYQGWGESMADAYKLGGGLREMFLIVQQLYRACLSSFCIVLREHSILSAVSGKIWEVIKFVFGNSSLLIITYVIY